MTRKDYVLIASAIAKMPSFSSSLRTAKRSAAVTLANALVTTNPMFNRERFLAACCVEDKDND